MRGSVKREISVRFQKKRKKKKKKEISIRF